MAWNQNGNGQGNGYGQQPQQGYPQQQQGYAPQGGYGQQDVYGRLDNARKVGGARFPYISAGTHKLALVSLEEFNPEAPKVRALFKTIESRTQQVGAFCVKIWSLVKPPRFQNGTTEADEFADFMMKLKNAPPGYAISSSIRTLLKERPQDQLARGTMIECTGVAGKVNPANQGKEPYVRVYWNTLAQAEPDVAAMRMRLEQEGIPSTSENAPQQNMGYGGGQPQQQYQQPMPQQGYQQGYQQAPQQQYGQPQPAPMGQPQYGHPSTASFQPQPQQMQQPAPQQGGFLANVPMQGPPQGNNGNGGQQGGGW